MTKYILPSNFIIANPRYNLNATIQTYRNITNQYHCGKNGTFDSYYPCLILNDSSFSFKLNNAVAVSEVIFFGASLQNLNVSIGRLEGANNLNIEKKDILFSSIISNYGGCAPELFNPVIDDFTIYYIIPGIYENLVKISNLISVADMANQSLLIPGAFYIIEDESDAPTITVYQCEVDPTTSAGVKFLAVVEKFESIFYAIATSIERGKSADIYEGRTFNPYKDNYSTLVTWHLSYF